MNLIGTCATNRMTGSKELENEGQDILDRPARCLQYRRLQRGRRRAAGGSARGLQDRGEIHQEIAGRRGGAQPGQRGAGIVAENIESYRQIGCGPYRAACG